MEDRMKRFSEETVAALASGEETALTAQATALRESISDLEDKERTVGERLTVAKEKGLLSSAAKCRTLMQRLIRRRCELEEELSAIEAMLEEIAAKREIDEIGEVTAAIDAEVFPTAEELTEIDCPDYGAVYHHTAKSKRMGVIARAFAWAGVLAGLFGALAYMLLVEYNYAHFRLFDLALFGGAALVLIVVGILFGCSANRQKKLANAALEQFEAEMRAYEAAVAEQQAILDAECVAWKHENRAAANAVEAWEREQLRLAAEAAEKARARAGLRGLGEKAKESAKILVPVAVACAAVACMTARTKKKKRAAQKKAILKLLTGE